MPAKFWLDRRGLAFDHKGTRIAANGHPIDVFKGLNGEINEFTYTSLYDMYKDDINKAELVSTGFTIPIDHALYISGTAKDLTAALQSLNEQETSGNGTWRTDDREMTSAAKFLDESGSMTPSSLQPHEVLEALTGNKHEALTQTL